VGRPCKLPTSPRCAVAFVEDRLQRRRSAVASAAFRRLHLPWNRTISMTEDRKPLVQFQKDGHVAIFVLDAPPANTYSHEMMLDLDGCTLQARFDPEVQVIVLTGQGEKFFCAGADIGMLQKADPTYKYYFCLHANETLSRLEQTPKLVIAALNGHTVGGGLEVAMAADLRLARKDCGKFGLPEVALGVLPGTGGTQRLARMVGKSKAIEMMVSGEMFGTDRALDLGIVNQVFDGDGADFMAQVMEYARSLTTPGKAAMAVGHIKRAVQTGIELPLEAGLTLERELQAKLFASADAQEGIRSYNEKRNAEFEGR
jgi:enoyl-CoA hydratase